MIMDKQIDSKTTGELLSEIKSTIKSVRYKTYKTLDFLLNDKGSDRIKGFADNSPSQKVWHIMGSNNLPLIEVNSNQKLEELFDNCTSIQLFLSNLDQDFYKFLVYFETNQEGTVTPTLFLTISEVFTRQKVIIHSFYNNCKLLKTKIRESNKLFFKYYYNLRKSMFGEKFQSLTLMLYHIFYTPIYRSKKSERLTLVNFFFNSLLKSKKIFLENLVDDTDKIIRQDNFDASFYLQNLNIIFSLFKILLLNKDEVEDIKTAFLQEARSRTSKKQIQNPDELKLFFLKHIVLYNIKRISGDFFRQIPKVRSMYEQYFTETQLVLLERAREAGITIPLAESVVIYSVPDSKKELQEVIIKLTQLVPLSFFAGQIDKLIHSDLPNKEHELLTNLEEANKTDQHYVFKYFEKTIDHFMVLLENAADQLNSKLGLFIPEIKSYIERKIRSAKIHYYFEKEMLYGLFSEFMLSGDLTRIILAGKTSLINNKLMFETIIPGPRGKQLALNVLTINLRNKWLGMVEVYEALVSSISHKDINLLLEALRKYPTLSVSSELFELYSTYSNSKSKKIHFFHQLSYYIEENNLPDTTEGRLLYNATETIGLSEEFTLRNPILPFMGFTDYEEYRLIKEYYRKNYELFQGTHKMFGKLFVNLSFVQKFVYMIFDFFTHPGKEKNNRRILKKEIKELRRKIYETYMHKPDFYEPDYTDEEREAAEKHIQKIQDTLSDSANKVTIDKKNCKMILIIQDKELSKDRKKLEDAQKEVEYNLTPNIAAIVVTKVNDLVTKNVLRIQNYHDDIVTVISGFNSP